MTQRLLASMVLNEPRRSESVRALSKGGRLLPALAARLIPNRAIRVASGLPRSARKAGTCSVGATLGLYSKLMSVRARLRGISLHSFRPRMRLHMARYGLTPSPTRHERSGARRHIWVLRQAWNGAPPLPASRNR